MMSKRGGRSGQQVILHMICGKIASGKSTLTKRLARTENALVISEDVWMKHLYSGEIRTLEDYVRCAGRIRRVLSGHVRALLSAGVSVILDFPFNIIDSRAWGRDLFGGTASINAKAEFRSRSKRQPSNRSVVSQHVRVIARPGRRRFNASMTRTASWLHGLETARTVPIVASTVTTELTGNTSCPPNGSPASSCLSSVSGSRPAHA